MKLNEVASADNMRNMTIDIIKQMILDATKRHDITSGTYNIQSDVMLPSATIEADGVIQQEVIWPMMSYKDKQIFNMYKGTDPVAKQKLFDRLMRTRWEKVNKCAVDIVRTIETGAYLKSKLALIKSDYKLEYVYSDFVTRLVRYTPKDFMDTFSKRQPGPDDLENAQTILIFRFTLPDEEE